MRVHTLSSLLLVLSLVGYLSAGEASGTDPYGDPLPAGAISRLGTVRWRHEKPIRVLTFSPDGSLLACAGRPFTPGQVIGDDPIRILDGRTGKPMGTLQGHDRTVYSICFSSSGKWLVSCGAGATVRLWDVAQQKMLWLYPVTSYAEARYLPDGTTRPVSDAQMAVLREFGESTAMQVAFAHDGKHVLATNRTGFPLTRQTVAPDGTRIITQDAKRWIRILDVATGKQVRQIDDSDWGQTYLMPDGKSAMSAEHDEIHLVEIATGKDRSTAKLDGVKQVFGKPRYKLWSPVTPYFWPSPDQRTAVLGWQDFLISVDVASGKLLNTVAQRKGRGDYPLVGASVAFSADGKLMALVLRKRTREIHIQDVRTGELRHKLSLQSTTPVCVAFFPDGKRLAVAHKNAVRLWDVETGKEISPDAGHRDTIGSVALSPDGSRAATASDDGTARLWDTRSGKELHRWAIEWIQPCEFRVAFSPDGKLLAVVKRGKIDVLACEDGKTLRSLSGYLSGKKTVRKTDTWSCAVAFSQDGKWLACARSAPWPGKEKVFQRWDMESGMILHEKHIDLSGEEGPESAGKGVQFFVTLVISPSLKRLVTSQFATHASFLCDADTGQSQFRVDSHPGFTTARFSPDERLVALGTQSGSLYLVESQGGKVVRKIAGPSGHSFPRTFLDEGRVLLSDHQDNSTRFWDVGSGEQIYRFEGHRIRACSADGRFAASVSADNAVLIWDLPRLRKQLAEAKPREETGSQTVADGQTDASPLSGPRTWTDSTGKYTVVAELLEINNEQVRLKKLSGSVITVPMTKLSDADQRFIQGL